MKAVIISDTHMPRMAKKLPPRLAEELSGADLIIHAGDWQTPALYSELSQFAPLAGVYGNADSEEIKELVEEKVLLELSGFRVGIVHGHGKGKTTEKRAMEAFADEKLDLLIYGHSHIPVNRRQDGMILFNPGSPTDKRRQRNYSFGILEIGRELSVRHVFYPEKK